MRRLWLSLPIPERVPDEKKVFLNFKIIKGVSGTGRISSGLFFYYFNKHKEATM